MSITLDEFDSFATYGRSRIGSGTNALSLDDLVIEWESRKHRNEINDAIRAGLADADAGRYRPASEALKDLRKRHGLAE